MAENMPLSIALFLDTHKCFVSGRKPGEKNGPTLHAYDRYFI